MISNKKIMVTGGTDLFGNTAIKKLIDTYNFKEVIIFSRDEKKHMICGSLSIIPT